MKPGHEPVLRVVVQLLRGADLLEQALAHDRDPLAHRHGLDLVVGDVDHRGAEALVEARDLGAGLDAQLGVEVGQRLVHQEHGGLADDRPAERDALPLAAGQLLGLAVEQLLQLEDPGRLADPPLDLRLGDLAQLQAEGEVVADRHVRVERVALEHHRDVAVLGRDVVDDLVADAQLALGDLLEPRDHPQAGRLPAPRRPDEHHELAVTDLEVEVRHGDHLAVSLEHVIERHGRHAGTSVPSRASRAHASGRRTKLAVSDEPRTRCWLGYAHGTEPCRCETISNSLGTVPARCPTERPMSQHPRAGQPAQPADLVDLDALVACLLRDGGRTPPCPRSGWRSGRRGTAGRR